MSGELEPVGDGWFRFYGELEFEKYHDDGSLLYSINSNGEELPWP